MFLLIVKLVSESEPIGEIICRESLATVLRRAWCFYLPCYSFTQVPILDPNISKWLKDCGAMLLSFWTITGEIFYQMNQDCNS